MDVVTTRRHRAADPWLCAAGVRGAHLHGVSLATVGLCVGLWIRAKAIDQEERGNAERRALFVGLWPSMFWLIGDMLQRRERQAQAAGSWWWRCGTAADRRSR